MAETFDKAAQKLESDLGTQPRRHTDLQTTLGDKYAALGLYREAIARQEKVREYALEWIPMNGTEFTTERTKAVSDQSQEVLAVVTHTGPSLCDDQ